jgi:uncharacterized membrane protein
MRSQVALMTGGLESIGSNEGAMMETGRPALYLYAIGIAGLGILSVLYHDFAYDWQPVPAGIPGRGSLALACGILTIAVSVALLFRASSAVAVRILLGYLIVWQFLKVPALIGAPRLVGVWLGFGEVAAILAGSWVLFARLANLDNTAFFRHLTGETGLRVARMVFALAVLPIGLSHIVYVDITASLVPAWMPYRVGLAYLTGVGQIACGLAMLFSRLARPAAVVEAVMVGLFAFLVWGPVSWFSTVPRFDPTAQTTRFAVTAFFITWLVGASAVLVASSVPSKRGSAQ